MTGIRGSLAGVASKPPRTVATSPAVIMLNAAVMSAFCRFPRSSQQALRRAFLVHSELDGVGRGGHKRGHGPREILDTSEEARLVEEAVVDRDIEAAAGLRIEGPIQACRFHGEEMRWTATKARRRRALGDVVSGVSLTHASKFSQPANDTAARAPHLSVCVTRNVFAARAEAACLIAASERSVVESHSSDSTNFHTKQEGAPIERILRQSLFP